MTVEAKPKLITPAFLALAIASLAFFTAGGIVLPVAFFLYLLWLH